MKEIIELIDKYWRFDNNQRPLSSWHEKQDLLTLLRAKQSELDIVKCGDCGHDLTEVRPGKHQCDNQFCIRNNP